MAIVIKKKSIWILLLLLVLGVSYVFLNNFSQNAPDKETSENWNQETQQELTVSVPEIEENFPKHSIEENEGSDQNFFVNYRLERDRIRSQEIEMLREIINNPNSEKHLREKAQQDLMKLVQLMEKEMILENLIQAKEFEDAIIFFTDGSVNVVVKKAKLTEPEVAQISDIVSKGTGISMDKIVIISRK